LTEFARWLVFISTFCSEILFFSLSLLLLLNLSCTVFYVCMIRVFYVQYCNIYFLYVVLLRRNKQQQQQQ